MPYLVNGQLVPEELIRQEAERLTRDVQFQSIPDEAERGQRLRAAAEASAGDKILIAQAAVSDPRPVDAATLEREALRQRAEWGRPSALDDHQLRQWVESQLRLQRIRDEMVASATTPTAEEVEAFFKANRDKFRKPELFHASHIVKHVNHEQSEGQAEAGIQAALAELERGVPFGEVADRHSDCKDKGGDLGQFPAGYMVEEFEEAIRALEPGQRTSIFTTPFGLHIALLHSKTAAGPATFEEVRTGIERVLTFAHEHEAYLCAVAELRSRADIRWVPENPASNCDRQEVAAS
jgi:peptidyl-prolyl cis-trans isomerase C